MAPTATSVPPPDVSSVPRPGPVPESVPRRGCSALPLARVSGFGAPLTVSPLCSVLDGASYAAAVVLVVTVCEPESTVPVLNALVGVTVAGLGGPVSASPEWSLPVGSTIVLVVLTVCVPLMGLPALS